VSLSLCGENPLMPFLQKMGKDFSLCSFNRLDKLFL